ncbi:MAG: hypothetical protein U5J62_00170 [Desulfurivibrio sp.]|nr:hypothetical protein [Desulfurivibrio sp.]
MPFLDLREGRKKSWRGCGASSPINSTLIAIVRRGGNYRAMVQDTTGYGHIVEPGTAIGRNSWVEEITPERLVIQQKISTLTGEEEYRILEMVLATEGEEKE